MFVRFLLKVSQKRGMVYGVAFELGFLCVLVGVSVNKHHTRFEFCMVSK